jgi:hypothetical protein
MDLLGRLTASVRRSPDDDRLKRHRATAAPYLDPLPRLPMPGPGYQFDASNMWLFDPKGQPWFTAILGAPAEARTAIAVALVERLARERRRDALDRYALPTLLSAMRADLPPFDEGDVRLLLSLARRGDRRADEFLRLLPLPVAAFERLARSASVSGALERAVRGLLEDLDRPDAGPASEVAGLRGRLRRILDSHDLDVAVFHTGDSWGVAMRGWVGAHADIPGLPATLLHLSSADAVAPSAKWRAAAGALLAEPGIEGLIRQMVDASFSSELADRRLIDAPPFVAANASLVRGAYWAAAVGGWPWVTETLGRAGLHWALSGRNDNYARDQALATTCAALLGEVGSSEAHAALGRMKAKVRNRTVAKAVERALARAAERAGTSPSELLELSVPSFGLDRDGRREIPIGAGAAILALDEDGVAELTWRAPDGRLSGSPPKALSAGGAGGAGGGAGSAGGADGATGAAAVRAAKDELKELRKALSVERGRVEDLLVESRSWPYAVWRARYLEHPLTRSFARRLIWRFRQGDSVGAGMLLGEDDVPTGVDDRPLMIDGESTVSVWHPIDASVEEVRAWRTFLLERRIRQPFKQAFREIYVLTPAERETATYSNRFAAHILEYATARALMTARRWSSNFLGPYDGGFEGVAKREFPTVGLRAEFAHFAVEEGGGFGHGPVDRCSTDRVEFRPLGPRNAEPVALSDVPSVVFSEAMRDVDLFVGVSSIAADANWQDGGANRDFTAYWERTAFGDLTATAETRREGLAWMLPQLAIAERLSLEDRWLRVQGELRSYRIHLGSGNVLMEPNDLYLCIVPGRSDPATRRVFLPFDTDVRLSLILSKAFLLAHDRSISDPSIRAQIERG